MANFTQELRYAIRMLWRRPGFTASAALTLALGIGANLAIFTVINVVLLRSLPFPAADRLVMVWETRQLDPNAFPDPKNIPAAQTHWWVSDTTFDRWKKHLGPFEAMAGFRSAEFGLSGYGEPERVHGAFAASAFFPLLGVQPFLGRTFLPEEDGPGAGAVAIISHGLWTRRFGAAPGALGAKILIDGVPHTVVGILSSTFEPTLPGTNRDTEVWLPLARDRTSERNFSIFLVAARLRPGMTLQGAQAEETAFVKSLHQENPRRYRGTGVNLVPLAEEMSHSIRPALLLLWGASAVVLLIAAVNMANLLVARGMARQREIGIRAVLGAGRWKLARQILLEGAVLALVGGALGMLAARWGISLLLAAAPEGVLPRISEIGADARVLGLGVLLSLAAGLLAAGVPAWSASRSPLGADLNETLNEASRSSSSRRARRLRSLLVVSEIALALVLMAGAGLLVRSFVRLTGIDPGFRPQHILTIGMTLPEAKYRDPLAQTGFAESVLDKLQSLGAPHAAAITNSLPMAQEVIASYEVQLEGRAKEVPVYLRSVTPDYFRLMSVPLRGGRFFTAADYTGETAIVNQAMIRRYWPDLQPGAAEPLGRRIKIAGKWREIVGVVSDIKHDGLAEETDAELYVPFRAIPSRWMTLVVRTTSDPMRLVAAVRGAVRAVDPDQPLQDIQSLEQVVYSSVAAPRFRMLLLAILAALALALAGVGIYGIVAYAVTDRTREIGIRMALGARRPHVLRMIVGDGLKLAAAGVLIGIAGALAATRVLASFLFGIRPTDAATLAAACLTLIAVAALASYLPARRATKVDPIKVLHWE